MTEAEYYLDKARQGEHDAAYHGLNDPERLAWLAEAIDGIAVNQRQRAGMPEV
jgi:hypothetical protein